MGGGGAGLGQRWTRASAGHRWSPTARPPRWAAAGSGKVIGGGLVVRQDAAYVDRSLARLERRTCLGLVSSRTRDPRQHRSAEFIHDERGRCLARPCRRPREQLPKVDRDGQHGIGGDRTPQAGRDQQALSSGRGARLRAHHLSHRRPTRSREERVGGARRPVGLGVAAVGEDGGAGVIDSRDAGAAHDRAIRATQRGQRLLRELPPCGTGQTLREAGDLGVRGEHRQARLDAMLADEQVGRGGGGEPLLPGQDRGVRLV